MKNFFNKLSQREKTLLTIFLISCLFVWGNFLKKRWMTFRAEYTTVSTQVEYQELWFAKEDSIHQRLEKGLRMFNPEKTYSKSKFIGRIDAIARSAGGTYDISSPKTKITDIFDENTLTIRFSNVPMKGLLLFDKAIESEGPYLSFEKIQISPNRTNPEELNANLDVIALELKNVKDIQRNTNLTPTKIENTN